MSEISKQSSSCTILPSFGVVVRSVLFGPLHIPNNTDRTTTPQDGKMVQLEDCFPISDIDPAIKQVRGLEASQ